MNFCLNKKNKNNVKIITKNSFIYNFFLVLLGQYEFYIIKIKLLYV